MNTRPQNQDAPAAPRPEVLSPAGDRAALEAAVLAGADAVYFGLQQFNARARASNFDEGSLADTVRYLHKHGVRAYITLNTLVFDSEISAMERAVRTCADAGVDAVIVQDLGVAKLVREIAPTLPVHASTQMTCTDASSVEFAREMGAKRVVLARELSLSEIDALRRETDVELEVFVHGALCVAYSGQCLTSEAIGGRSANRGACAQACRLPYDLVVDGALSDTGDEAFLLSPEDLEASDLVPKLAEMGVRSLKIEGRLKGAPYVAATTKLYRTAVDALDGRAAAPTPEQRADALQTFSRGSGPGFLTGVDHQRLVEGRACDHRGLEVATLLACDARGLELSLSLSIAKGDGLLIEGARGGEGELGGRVWSISVQGRSVDRAEPGQRARVSFGPDRDVRAASALVGHRVFRTDDPQLEKRVVSEVERAPRKLWIDVTVHGAIGEKPVYTARTERGVVCSIEGDALVDRARGHGTDEAALRDKLGRLGESAYALRSVECALGEGAFIAPASINRARRALLDEIEREGQRSWPCTEVTAESLIARAHPPAAAPSSRFDASAPRLFVLCRTLSQAHAAVDAGADGVYLDFLELQGTGAAVRALRERGPVHITLAPPRIRKPGEEKIDRYLASLSPDAVLIRSLGALRDLAPPGAERIGDFSLNVTNRITAGEVLARGLVAFTPSFDLDAAQLCALIDGPFAPWTEIVVHHPMPLFHMEHCVIAARLSDGKDYRDCGRPCERHQLSLRDRAGIDHPIEADVGCRNTVFHGRAQSGASVVKTAMKSGVFRFRVELVRESAEDVGRIVSAYRSLLRGQSTDREVWKTLGAEGHYGVVRGSLRVLNA
ncbi:MAG: U32 family peptidase [Polyangiales bacterium]